MTPQEFENFINKKAKEIQNLVNNKLPRLVSDTALRFINGNFRAQGWQGKSFVSWKKNKRNGRILVNKGHLRSSFFPNYLIGEVIIRSTLPYAAIHNEGGSLEVPVTAKMRKFAWAMYYKEVGKTAERRKKRMKTSDNDKPRKSAKPKKIKISKNAERWKGLALTKKTYLNINIERRQFTPTNTSPSPVLDNAVLRKIDRELNIILNNSL